MAQGLVFVLDKTLGIGPLFGFQAGPGTGDDIFSVKGTTTVAELDQTESFIHNSLHYGRERNRAKKDCARVAPDSAGIRQG